MNSTIQKCDFSDVSEDDLDDFLSDVSDEAMELYVPDDKFPYAQQPQVKEEYDELDLKPIMPEDKFPYDEQPQVQVKEEFDELDLKPVTPEDKFYYVAQPKIKEEFDELDLEPISDLEEKREEFQNVNDVPVQKLKWCFFCFQSGHIKPNCPDRLPENQTEERKLQRKAAEKLYRSNNPEAIKRRRQKSRKRYFDNSFKRQQHVYEFYQRKRNWTQNPRRRAVFMGIMCKGKTPHPNHHSNERFRNRWNFWTSA